MGIIAEYMVVAWGQGFHIFNAWLIDEFVDVGCILGRHWNIIITNGAIVSSWHLRKCLKELKFIWRFVILINIDYLVIPYWNS